MAVHHHHHHFRLFPTNTFSSSPPLVIIKDYYFDFPKLRGGVGGLGIPRFLCSSSSDSSTSSSKSNRKQRGKGGGGGFGPKEAHDNNNKKITPYKNQSSTLPSTQLAPRLTSPTPTRRPPYTSSDDLDFELRLQAVTKLALDQKKAQDVKENGVIDYDAPTNDSNGSTIGLGTKIGVGVAVVAFGLVFALGDFLPTASVSPQEEESATVDSKIPDKERVYLEKRLKQFEETLEVSHEDATALEGAAVTLAEMREYKRAATLLDKLIENKPSDPDAFRLLGEVKYELQDYKGSVVAYKSAEKASNGIVFEILRGFTNSLLADKKPDEAVQVLLASRERLNKEKSTGNIDGTVSISDVDPIQVDLLLGKAYSDWGHISDAVAVYDKLISSHPDDFRGYLAKGIILKENGSIGDAERMFIQARFFAPDKAKLLVDKYSRR